MKQVFLLLMILITLPRTETWEDTKSFLFYPASQGGGNGYTVFGDSLLLGTSFESPGISHEEIKQRMHFYAIDDGIDSMGVYKRYFGIFINNKAMYTSDSIWISKYWMDDSLLEVPVVMDKNVDINDFRLLPFDALHTEYDLYSLLDERLEDSFGNYQRWEWESLKSFALLYKKDSSYYAFCLLGYRGSCYYDLSCQFQDDGTTNFEKIPDLENIENAGCPTSIIPTPRRNVFTLPDSTPYLINGTRSKCNSSNVLIQDGQPKLKLKR